AALAGGVDRHRHRPRRDAVLPPRGDDRRRRGTRRRHDREAGRTVRRGAARGAGPAPAAPAAFVTGLSRGDGAVRPGGTALGAIVAVAAVAAALMFSAPAATEPVHDVGPIAIQVHAKIINLFLPRDQDQVRFGALEFRGGLELTSDYREFGGFSALRMDPD